MFRRAMWDAIRLARRLPMPVPANPDFEISKPHHRPTGFRNPGRDRPITAEDEARRMAPGVIPEVLDPVAPDLAFLHTNRTDPAITWIGHATVLMQMGGRNILTDPIFTTYASPIQFAGPRRRQRPGVEVRDLPHIDLVVVSHSHYDHASVPSLRALARQPGGPPHYAVPLGMRGWLRRKIGQVPVTSLDWWQHAEVAGMRITLAPAHHWSARTPWDRNRTLWGSWVVERDGFRFFFSGDIAYSEDSEAIGATLGPFDAAAIAIGHYEPRAFLKNHHVNPDEAVLVHREVRSRQTLAIHWGTFDGLTPEPLYQPVADLAAARAKYGVAEDAFFVLRHGQTRRL